MVYIRVDANKVIATGHIMRCITIADRLKVFGEKVKFLLSDKESTTLLNNTDYEYIILDTNWNNLNTDDEIVKMKKILASYEADKKVKLLIDSYYVNDEYTKILGEYAYVIIIDDLFQYKYNADILINYTLHYYMYDYYQRYNNSKTKLCLGGAYAPIRQQFLNVKKYTGYDNCNKNILVICGGGDTLNSLTKIINGIARNEDLWSNDFQIVVGAYNPYYKELVELSKRYKWVHIHKRVSNMAELMSKCDIAISAASTVLYECCVMKLPTIYYIVASNQNNTENYFSKNNMMLYAGNMMTEPDKVVINICKYIIKLQTNEKYMLNMQRQMEKTVDGKGAMRIAKEIVNLE